MIHGRTKRVTGLHARCLGSKEFLDLAVSEIDQRKRPAGRPGELGFEVEAKAVEDRRGDVGRFDGTVRRHGADRIAGPDHPAPLNAAAGEARP